MKYFAENTDLIYFCGSKDSELLSAELDEENKTLTLCISDCIAKKDAPWNDTGGCCEIPKLWLTLSDYRITGAWQRGYRTVNPRDNTIRQIKGRRLYKSEHENVMKRLCGGGDIDVFSFGAVVMDENDNMALQAELNIEDDERAWYGLKLSFSGIKAEWEEFGEKIPEKLTLKMKAALLKANIPAVFLALGHKDTPPMAKLAAGLALGYALSPIDLIPDFIPVLGYLDDVLIVSGLLTIALKLIPKDVMRECEKRAAKECVMPKKRWFYALPIIIIWLIVIALIIKLIFDIMG